MVSSLAYGPFKRGRGTVIWRSDPLQTIWGSLNPKLETQGLGCPYTNPFEDPKRILNTKLSTLNPN